MKITYSCVVDRAPKFFRQALTLAKSLQAVGVPLQDVTVNLTPPAGIYRGYFEQMGCRVCDTEFFADGKYCNKVAQLRNAPDDVDFVICCDTDIMFLRDIGPDLAGMEGHVVGKIVDFDNPPLKRLSAVAGLDPTLPEIPEVPADVNRAPTLQGNFNGGLYIIPGSRVREFSAAWEAEALRLYGDAQAQEILGDFAWHIDQISFCFTLNRLELPFKTLPITFNFPLHFAVDESRVRDPGDLRILHYHDAVDENFLPVTTKIKGRENKVFIQETVKNFRHICLLEDEKAKTKERAKTRFTFLAGFHRSGTSLLAAGCESLGYSIGTGKLMAASFDNPKGYYENIGLVKINEQIEKNINSDWDDIFFSFGGKSQEIYNEFAPRIAGLLQDEFLIHGRQNYMLKDPRVMQTYRIWKEAIEAMGYGDPEVVFVVRNPLECAQSQKSRHDKSFKKENDPFHFFGADLRETLLLWYMYTARFLMTLRQERIIIVSYGDLLDKPKDTLFRIGSWSGLQTDQARVDNFVNNFFEKGLRHHEIGLGELRAATKQIPYVFDMYEKLMQLASQNEITPQDIRRVSEAHREPFSELLQYDFMGRLFAVPKQHWIHERHMRMKSMS